MSDTEIIKSFVEEYHLQIGGMYFWTPYFINKPRAFGPTQATSLKGPFLGKGTPAQIRGWLNRHIEATAFQGKTAHDFRKFMVEHCLGIECSGFAYHVLDRYLRYRGLGSLQRYLYWSKEELLAAYDNGTPWHRPELNRHTVEAYPDQVPLGQVKLDWGWKTPRKLVGVRRLVNEAAAIRFDDVTKLRTGDMIYQLGLDDIAHVVVVVDASPKIITYAHAGGLDAGEGDPNYFGGVEYGHIAIVDPKLPIEQQSWDNPVFLKLHRFDSGALRRLRVLDRG